MSDIIDYQGKQFRVLRLEQQPLDDRSLWVAVLMIAPGATDPDFDIVVGLGVSNATALADAKSRARALVDSNLRRGTDKP